jgi:alkylation response protein AidB-like acyl-CoA dehydrogenase
MDFGFSQEQELLRQTARSFLEKECPSAFVRRMMDDPAGTTDELWGKLAELGWLGLVYPEAHGGMGLGLVDLTVVLEEMGRAVMPGPFFSTVLLGGLAVLHAGSDAQKAAWLPRIAAGEARATLALLGRAPAGTPPAWRSRPSPGRTAASSSTGRSSS